MATRNGTAEWKGDLRGGAGTFELGSGLFSGSYSFQTRFEEEPGTNPEELIAAAHASCYCMALAYELSQAGQVPERLATEATCTFDQRAGNWKITSMQLSATGRIPNCDADLFQKLAQAAKEGCPVSLALGGNVAISVSATLEACD